MTIQDDITHRSADIHWPDGLTPTDSDLFAHNEIVIRAPAEQIWQHLIAATAWPWWYSNAANVIVNDPSELLAASVTFDWTTFGLQISSTVAEFAPPVRLGWYGNGEGLRAYHTWLLVPREDSTYVVMEESASVTAPSSSRGQTQAICTVATTSGTSASNSSARPRSDKLRRAQHQ